MSEKMNQTKLVMIDEAQRIANDKFGKDAAKTTNILLWDDGDFKVTVRHGNGETREKIVYRSSGSDRLDGDCFYYIEDEVTECEEMIVYDSNKLSP
jgi:hypothetical protein